MQPSLYRCLAIVFCCMSLLIILGESTLYTNSPSNVFPMVFNHNYGEFGTQALCLIPLVYIVFSTNSSMFELKLQKIYGFYKKHTQSPSLIYSACFMARLIPVLSYNFLILLNVKGSEFGKVISALNIIPYFGEQYSLYFPILIGIVCVLNAFNVYNKIVKAIGLERFMFAEVLDEGDAVRGRAIVAKDRLVKERELRESKRNEYSVRISVDQEHALSLSASLQY